MKSERFQLVAVDGTHYEMGYKHGRECKDLVNWNLDAFLFGRCFRGQSKEELLNLAHRFLPAAEDYAPELIEECRGVADGAGRTFDEYSSGIAHTTSWCGGKP